MHNLFDGTFNGMSGSVMYRALLAPDLFPHQKPMRLENWSQEEREMYCGGQYVKGAA